MPAIFAPNWIGSPPGLLPDCRSFLPPPSQDPPVVTGGDVLAAVLVGALFYVGWLPRGVPADGARTSLVRFDVPTRPSDTPTSFALSPDGLISCLRPNETVTRSCGCETSIERRVFHCRAPNGSFPFWSPDGRAVGSSRTES